MTEDISSLFFKFVKFGCTGFLGMFWDFCITYLLKEYAKMQKYVASAFGLLMGATSNYIVNSLWTFKEHGGGSLNFSQYVNFLIVSLFGFALNLTLIYVLHQKRNINFYLSKFIAIVVVFLWNFSINYFFTFRK